MTLNGLIHAVWGELAHPYVRFEDGSEYSLETRVPTFMFEDQRPYLDMRGYTMFDAYQEVTKAVTNVDPELAYMLNANKDQLADYIYTVAHNINREMESYLRDNRPVH